MIGYGELINGLSFVSEIFIGENSNSKSYIYYQDKVLLYEDTDLTKVNKRRDSTIIANNIVEKILRRLINETDIKEVSLDTQYKINKYVWETLKSGLYLDYKWHIDHSKLNK